MQFRKSLMTAALAVMLQVPASGMAQTMQMPAMDGWSKDMGSWMTAMTDPKMMNAMMGMMDPKMMEPWMKAMTDPKMMESMMKMMDPKMMSTFITAMTDPS
jgi:hypothetical protein